MGCGNEPLMKCSNQTVNENRDKNHFSDSESIGRSREPDVVVDVRYVHSAEKNKNK